MIELLICHRCPHSAKADGVRPCTIDGVSIVTHAERKECPRGYFDYGDNPPPYEPAPARNVVQLTVRRTRHGVVLGEPDAATLEQATQYATALFTAADVPAELARERNQTCTGCEYARWSTARDAPWCSICGCNVGAEAKGFLSFFLKTLAQKAENLPKWGCKHPRRDRGEGWRR